MQIFTIVTLMTCISSCNGQEKKETFAETNKIETREVIVSNAPDIITRAIQQDGNGNIWIATYSGVLKYDGKTFENITNKLAYASFFGILIDKKGDFWFSSVGSGVYFYDGTSFKNITTKDGLISDRVSNFYEDSKGLIWIATQNGISKYDGKEILNYYPSKDSTTRINDNDINSIIEDNEGKFWIGTRGNLFHFDGEKFKAVTNNGKPFTNVRKIIKDTKGKIWFGGSDGFWCYINNSFINFSQDFTCGIFEAKNGDILTISESKQNDFSINKSNQNNFIVSRYDIKTLFNQTSKVSIVDPKVGTLFEVFEAKDGSIWFGGLSGIYRFDGMNVIDYNGTKK